MTKTQHVICNKEAEIATMAERIKNIETKVEEVHKDMKEFIKTADNKYATKEELNEIKGNVKDNTSKIWDIAQKVTTVVTTVGIIWVIIKGGV